MKQIILFMVVIFFTLPLTQSCNSNKKYPEELDRLTGDGAFIFKGKILVLHSNTTDEDSVDRTGVVEVTEVIEAPENLKESGNQQITVRFADITKMKEGEERLFFTEPYWYGESLGVYEKGSYTKGDKLYDTEDLSNFINQAHSTKMDSQLISMLKVSPVVVAGKVVQINELRSEDKGLTEHDPQWKEAEIDVSDVLKGKADGNRIKIIYSASNDVMFYRSPKFNIGDEGIFIIEKTDARVPKNFTNDKMILTPTNFIKGKEKVSKIKSLLK